MAKLNWLEEVKADAEYNTLKRIREQEEERGHKESKLKMTEAKETKEDDYKESVTSTGKTQYRKNGKLISKEEYDSRG